MPSSFKNMRLTSIVVFTGELPAGASARKNILQKPGFKFRVETGAA